MQGDDLLLELLSKVLELFVQQGLEASKVQKKVEINVSVLPFEHKDTYKATIHYMYAYNYI